MGENIESHIELSKLALIVDGIDTIYQNSRSFIVIELNRSDFISKWKEYLKIPFDDTKKEFKIIISNTEFIFISNV